MEHRLPLSALLSQVLVGFIIEFDNEFEHRMPHRTTQRRASAEQQRRTPWLVSMVMWSRFLQFIPAEGITVGELQRVTGNDADRMKHWLQRMDKWWSYVRVEQTVSAGSGKSEYREGLVRPTEAGWRAQETWRPLTHEIEKRWEERFGEGETGELRESLRVLTERLEIEDLPDALPILGYGLFSKGPQAQRCCSRAQTGAAASEPALPALLSKVLLAFALRFERDSEISLAICSTVLRVAAGTHDARVRDLPRLTGVSKEAVAMARGFLEKRGYARAEAEVPGGRTKALKLTEKGQRALSAYDERVSGIEKEWEARAGCEVVGRVRKSLERMTADWPKFLSGLEPHSDGWRAGKPERLPYFPMILHRGGFPDGS